MYQHFQSQKGWVIIKIKPGIINPFFKIFIKFFSAKFTKMKVILIYLKKDLNKFRYIEQKKIFYIFWYISQWLIWAAINELSKIQIGIKIYDFKNPKLPGCNL